MTDELVYAQALARICNFNSQVATELYHKLGSAKAVYEHRHEADIMPAKCTPRLRAALADWDIALRRAEQEAEFASRHAIQVLTPADSRYPARLAGCADAPLVVYYRGTAPLNATRVVAVVGTRRCTAYGQDLIRRMMADLAQLCPGALVVSGLAYGVDIHAHRRALENGLDTVGVLAHGLDRIYPPSHRDTALEMVSHGGLLTELMAQTNADKANFVRRNRIVAGMADATILVESADHGGGLITAGLARNYERAVLAFPGPVGARYSEGCNNLVRDRRASLVTSAADIVRALGWQEAAAVEQAKARGIERQIFPCLTDGERLVADTLSEKGDLPVSMLAMHTGQPVGKLQATLFQLELKGVVQTMAGGVYHLLQ